MPPAKIAFPDATSCLVPKVRLPEEWTHLDPEEELAKSDVPASQSFRHRPWRHPMAVRTIKAGAVFDFLTQTRQ